MNYKNRLSVVIIAFVFWILIPIPHASAAIQLNAYVADKEATLLKSWNMEPYQPTIPWMVDMYVDQPTGFPSSYGYTRPKANISVLVDCGNGAKRNFNMEVGLSTNQYATNKDVLALYGGWGIAGAQGDNGCVYYTKPNQLATFYNYSATGTLTVTYPEAGLNISVPISTSVQLVVKGYSAGIFLASDVVAGSAPLTVQFSGAAWIDDTNGASFVHPTLGEMNFDCTNDGIYEKSVTTKGIYRYNVCIYTKPGKYTAALKGMVNPKGIWREPQTDTIDIYVYPKDNVSSSIDPSAASVIGEAPFSLPITLTVNNFFNGYVEYKIDCQVGSKAFNGKSFTFDARQLDVFDHTTEPYSCVYNTPGEYDLSASVKSVRYGTNGFNVTTKTITDGGGYFYLNTSFPDLPHRNYSQTYIKKINVTGKVVGGSCAGADECYNEQSPFDFEWEVNNASSCSIVGMQEPVINEEVVIGGGGVITVYAVNSKTMEIRSYTDANDKPTNKGFAQADAQSFINGLPKSQQGDWYLTSDFNSLPTKVTNTFSKINLLPSDQISVPKLLKGDYRYKLTCIGLGGSKERIIKVKVVN
jgi:hypothetical protein